MRGAPGIRQAEEKVRKGIEKVPVIRRVMPPGTFEREKQQKRMATLKDLEAIPDTPEGNADILRTVKHPPITKPEARAMGIETLAKRKELSDETKAYIGKAQKEGANVKAIYMARPDFAPFLTTIDPTTKKSRSITKQEVMNKIEPTELVKNIQKEALDDADIAIEAALDERKFIQMSRHLKPEAKTIFKRTMLNPQKTPSRPLTANETTVIKKRINQLSNNAEWRIY
jgi:hypothetical protein